jgi:ribosomal protein S13
VARISGVDLPKNKRMEVALTYIYGIGSTRARQILKILASVRIRERMIWPIRKYQQLEA